MNLFFLHSILAIAVQPIAVILTPTNHVSIKGRIDNFSASKFISQINNLNTSTIHIYIDSPGGDVESGQKIAQYINFKKDTNRTILCIAWEAHSMAFNILQYCTHRYVLKDSKMMQHQMSAHNINGNIENINNYMKITNILYERLIADASKRIGLTPEDYRQKINNDWYLYGEDIVKNNVADAVISSIGCNYKLTEHDSTEVLSSKLAILSLCPLI